jgi:hypothetical protein
LSSHVKNNLYEYQKKINPAIVAIIKVATPVIPNTQGKRENGINANEYAQI